MVLAADAGLDTAGPHGATEIGAHEKADIEIRLLFRSWRRLYRVDLGTDDSRDVGPGAGLTVWVFSLHDGAGRPSSG